MKKLFLATALMLGFAGLSFAQTTAPAATAAKPATHKKMEAKKPSPATAAPAPKAVTTTAPSSTGTVLKKDGTPDKRYKTAPAAAGPVKKDGTPDKRYKANKTAAPATAAPKTN